MFMMAYLFLTTFSDSTRPAEMSKAVTIMSTIMPAGEFTVVSLANLPGV